jgi:uncharacterized protein
VRDLPMFPLGTVLFPHQVLPLHVFEPRYRVLMHDVLSGEREFGVVLISHGHEVGGGDERVELGTVARIVQAEELEDGRWLTITVGTTRFAVDEWLPEDPYPRAAVHDLGHDEAHDPATAVVDRAQLLAPKLRRVLAMQSELGDPGGDATFELATEPEVLCWQPAIMAPLTTFDAQRVLAVDGCLDRLDVVDELLDDLEASFSWRLRAAD